MKIEKELDDWRGGIEVGETEVSSDYEGVELGGDFGDAGDYGDGVEVSNYTPSCPELRDFHLSDCGIRGVMGPVGCGKTSAVVMEIFIRAMGQESNRMGVRSTRWAVVRNTKPDVVSGPLASWKLWIPELICRTVSVDGMITGRLRLPHPSGDGTKVDAEISFLGMDEDKDIRKFKGREYTGVWFNEAISIPEKIFNEARGRVPRWPPKKWGVPITWGGIIMDYNPPNESNWVYRMVEDTWYRDEEFRKNSRFWKLPAPIIKVDGTWVRNPAAAYVDCQQRGVDYWLDMIRGMDDDWINVNVGGNYGVIQEGRAIYPEWSDGLFVSDGELEPRPELPILVGLDYGLGGMAAILMQMQRNGQVWILEEYEAEDMSMELFCSSVLKPVLFNKYRMNEKIYTGDPSGVAREKIGGASIGQYLMSQGIPVHPAQTNAIETRIEAVKHYLNTPIGVGHKKVERALLVNKRCRTLINGFNGLYRRGKIKTSANEAMYTANPVKNRWSHIHDATQYGCMYYYNEKQFRVVATHGPAPKRIRGAF